MRLDVGMQHWLSFQTSLHSAVNLLHHHHHPSSSRDGESEFTEALHFHFLFIQQYTACFSSSHLLPAYWLEFVSKLVLYAPIHVLAWSRLQTWISAGSMWYLIQSACCATLSVHLLGYRPFFPPLFWWCWSAYFPCLSNRGPPPCRGTTANNPHHNLLSLGRIGETVGGEGKGRRVSPLPSCLAVSRTHSQPCGGKEVE